jgi:hypothetical protein
MQLRWRYEKMQGTSVSIGTAEEQGEGMVQEKEDKD